MEITLTIPEKVATILQQQWPGEDIPRHILEDLVLKRTAGHSCLRGVSITPRTAYRNSGTRSYHACAWPYSAREGADHSPTPTPPADTTYGVPQRVADYESGVPRDHAEALNHFFSARS